MHGDEDALPKRTVEELPAVDEYASLWSEQRTHRAERDDDLGSDQPDPTASRFRSSARGCKLGRRWP